MSGIRTLFGRAPDKDVAPELTERVRGGAQSADSRPAASDDADAGAGGPEPAGDYKEHVRRFEIDLILRALRKHNGNQTEAAKALNLPLRTLVHKIQTYGIKKKFDR